jgi:hypothetical protein
VVDGFMRGGSPSLALSASEVRDLLPRSRSTRPTLLGYRCRAAGISLQGGGVDSDMVVEKQER